VNPNNAFFAGMAAALICLLLIGIVFLVCWIFFCLTLQRMQTEVRPRNRLIPPGSVWLHLLHVGGIVPFAGPFFSLGAYVWDLIMVLKLAGSLEREFDRRELRESGGGFGKPAGLVWCGAGLALTLLNVVSLFLSQFLNPNMGNQKLVIVLALVVVALWLVSVVCWIIYWVQMAGYGRKLREGRRGYRTGSIEEDYDDEFRDPLRERDEDDEDDDDRPRHKDNEFNDDVDDRPRRRRRGDELDLDDRPDRRDRDDR